MAEKLDGIGKEIVDSPPNEEVSKEKTPRLTSVASTYFDQKISIPEDPQVNTYLLSVTNPYIGCISV
jgi:hypothetical protein